MGLSRHSSLHHALLVLILVITTTWPSSEARADFWASDGDLDESIAAITLQVGVIGLHDTIFAEVPFNIVNWLAIAPYGVFITTSIAGESIHTAGGGGNVRFQTPFSDRAYRVFTEIRVGVIAAIDDRNGELLQGTAVSSGIKFHSFAGTGIEFKLWDRVTWSLAAGLGQRGLSDVHAAFGEHSFSAYTGFRGYF